MWANHYGSSRLVNGWVLDQLWLPNEVFFIKIIFIKALLTLKIILRWVEPIFTPFLWHWLHSKFCKFTSMWPFTNVFPTSNLSPFLNMKHSSILEMDEIKYKWKLTNVVILISQTPTHFKNFQAHNPNFFNEFAKVFLGDFIIMFEGFKILSFILPLILPLV